MERYNFQSIEKKWQLIFEKKKPIEVNLQKNFIV